MVLDALLYFSLAAIFGKDIDGVDKVFKSCCLDLNYPSFKDLAHSFLICFRNYKNAQLLYAVMLLLRGCVWVNKIIFCDSAKLHQRFIHGAYTDPLLPEPLIKSHFLLPGKFYDLRFIASGSPDSRLKYSANLGVVARSRVLPWWTADTNPLSSSSLT